MKTLLFSSLIFCLFHAGSVVASSYVDLIEKIKVKSREVASECRVDNFECHKSLLVINNEVNRMWKGRNRDTDDFVKLVVAMWELNSDDFEANEKKIIGHDIVKLAVSDILGQAVRNGLVSFDSETLREYVLSRLERHHVLIYLRAIGALGMVGDDRDIPFLINVAKAEQLGAQAAINALGDLNTDKARIALLLLENELKDPKLIDKVAIELR